MGSVFMETDEGIMTDNGLWGQTYMEQDLLDTDYRTDSIDYFGGHDFAMVESDPLLPLINSIMGAAEKYDDDCGQFFLSSPQSKEGRCGENTSSSCHKLSDLDSCYGSSFSLLDAASTAARIQEVDASFPLGEIIIKTEPSDLRGSWLNPSGFDSDTSSTGSGGSRSPSQSHGKGSGFALTPSCSSDGESLASPLCSGNSSRVIHNSSLNLATAISNSLSTGDDGNLLLTDEEKRTLTAEGYPIPSRLPLTKAEERSLKRIRRKIKNKISAQESRRKKKEYIESLEKKLKNLNDDNSDLRRKLETSESTHRSLAEQLCKYQTLLKAKVQITPVRRVIPTQTEKSS